MIERDLVLALDHVEVAERIFRGSNSARVVCLRKRIQRRFKQRQRLICMTLFEQSAAARERRRRVGLRSGGDFKIMRPGRNG